MLYNDTPFKTHLEAKREIKKKIFTEPNIDQASDEYTLNSMTKAQEATNSPRDRRQKTF
jgi:hypothetical protein